MNFTYETQGAITYLVCELDPAEQLDNLTLGMLTNNHISGLAPVLYTEMNGQRYLKYNISAKLTADHFFSATMNKQRTLTAFQNILNAICSVDEYMIDLNCFLLASQHVYLNVSSCESAMVCVPVVSDKDINQEVKAFFNKILNDSQFDKNEDDTYVAQLIAYINGNDFSVYGLKDIVGKLQAGIPTGIVLPEPAPRVQAPVDPAPAPAVPVAPVSSFDSTITMEDMSSILEQKPAQPAVPVPPAQPAVPVPPAQPAVPVPPAQPAVPVPPAQPAVPVPPAQPAVPVPPAQPAIPVPPAKPAVPVPPAKPAVPVPPAQPAIPVPPVKPAIPVPPAQPAVPAGRPINSGMPTPMNNVPQPAAKPVQPPVTQQAVPAMPKPPVQNNPGFAIPGQPTGVAKPQIPVPPTPNAQPKAEPAGEKKMSLFGLLSHYNKENAEIYKKQKEAAKAQKAAAAAQPPVGAVPAPNGVPQNPAQASPAGMPVPPQNAVPQYNAPIQPVPVPVQNSFNETTVLSPSMLNGETTVLGVNPTLPDPSLMRIKTGEKISINKPVFRIGKEKSYVDYFIADNTAISRSHANIHTENGEYFIEDTNSTNHTYINGQLVPSNVKTKLTSGDRVRLANEDFVFSV